MKRILLLIFVNCILLHSGILFAGNEVYAAVEATPAPSAAGGGAGQAPSATSSAEVSELPVVHILPDNPLYFLKTVKEKIQLLIARSASSQADLILDFSQKRLAEALKVAEKGKIHISEKLLTAFGQDIKTAQEKIKEAKERGEKTYNLLVELQKTVAYQKSVIEELGDQAEQLGSFLVEIDEGLGEATESGKMQTRQPEKGLGILDWIRGLLGKKEILKPLVR
jgi:hypothetical protein